MNKIEVDPTLFITCRLCLEDLGVYQIVPAVKELISYCFDIIVEPFDGLPQLICKKCEAILCNYSEIKKKFTEKQNDLRAKIKGTSNGQESIVETQCKDSIEKIGCESNNGNQRKFKKRIACISSSSNESYQVETYKNNRSENESDSNEKASESWPANYTKQYVCRICNSRWLDLKLIKKHINSRHSALKKKYNRIFKRHCEVRLQKTDGKLNITGSKRKVVYRKEKIIQNVSSKYYIIYTTKDYKDDEEHNEVCHSMSKEIIDSAIDDESSESSADDIVFKHKRTRRLFSKSSTDTVVLDTANKSNMSDNDKESHISEKEPTSKEFGECINIDDSSDSEPENVTCANEIMVDKQISDINKKDLKVDQVTINDVITSCQNKYIKKHYHDQLFSKANKTPSAIAIQLKRKILSIGRKIINKKKGFNCTPLLRFMEHKNLDITWLPREFVHMNQDSHYIRLMTRMKNIGDNCDYEKGWTNYTSTTHQNHAHSAVQNVSDNFVEVSRIEPNAVNAIDISKDPCVSFSETTLTESAMLVSDATNVGTDTKKLLNANPVANPKQLPKKTPIKPVLLNAEVILQDTEKDFSLPIITSTTSLAVQSMEENIDTPNNISEKTSSSIDEQKSETPRIKVKPASELMSKETLNRMQEPTVLSNIVNSNQPMPEQNENNVIKIYMPQLNMVSQLQNTVQPNHFSTNLIAPEPAWQSEFMILDTIELPNTRTNSPFLYLKKLLQLHDIILLDTNAELSNDFNCLIKFKVLYKQDNTNHPVILCLSLFCSKNVFCLKIKDRNQDNLNLVNISPNWQWEVLKIYKGEVVHRLLSNAQRISQDVYEFTNCFLCLLKSINLKKML